MKEKIFLGADHAGFKLKETIKKELEKLSYKYDDVGTFSEEPCDYPVLAFKVAQKAAKSNGKGILMCGSGSGETIVANKVRGIRAVNCFNEYTAKMAREHNDANILCMGARILSENEAKKIVKIFLETKFSSEARHRRRVSQIKSMEEKMCK